MGRLLGKSASKKAPVFASKCDWRRGMSNNVAYALLTYTVLQIFVTVAAMERGVGSILPYFALVVLVVGIIPACRFFERRWLGLSDQQAADKGMAGAYRRDQLGLWVLAIGLPFVLTAIYKTIAAA
jgi:hypothetical protein